MGRTIRVLWAISALFALHLPQATGIEVRIGAMFDDNINETQQMLRFAVEAISTQESELQLSIEQQGIEVPYGNEFYASKKMCQLLKWGVSAIFGPTSPSTSMHCMNICDAKEIPYVEFRWDADTRPPIINMHPHPDTMAMMLVDMIYAWGWNGFTILYESAPWLPRVSELLKLYATKEYTVTVRRINLGLGNNNYRSVLMRVKASSDANYVIDCSIDALPEVLKQAQQVGLISDQNEIIITTPDMHTIDLEPYQYSGANITGLRFVDPENPLVVAITNNIAETMAENEEEPMEGLQADKMRIHTAMVYDAVLLLADAVKALSTDESDLLQPRRLNCINRDSWDHGNSITNFMRNSIVQGLTGEVKFDNEGLRKQFSVDIVELSNSGLHKIGTWNSSLDRPDRLNFTRVHKTFQPIDEGSLNNRTFKVITALSPPYGMLKDTVLHLSGNDRYEGFGIDLIHELSVMLGFNYTFQLQDDGNYGSKINGTNEWSGMIKELLEFRADLAITDLTITSERESGVDFTMPFMNLGISILYRKPTKVPPSTFSFMSPFSTEVWIYLGTAYLGVSLCLFVLGRISPSEWDNPYPCIEEPTELENQFSLCNSLWFTIGALLQQGSEIAPKSPSTRVVAAIWWFFTLIMVSSYTANLAAFLTIESMVSKLTSAEQLSQCYSDPDKCVVDFGAKRGGSTFNFFKEATQGTYKNMYTYMENHPEFMTIDNDQGQSWASDDDRPSKKNYAFLMESSSIEYIVERNCKLTQVGGLLDDKGYGIAMRKNSPYRSALSEGVLRLQEQGKLTQLKSKWWKEKKGGGACSKKSGGDEAGDLGIENMSGVFIVLMVGSAVASGFGFIEWFFLIFIKSTKHKVPFKEELMAELKFVAMCQGNTKTVRHRKSSSLNTTRQSQSIDRSREQSMATLSKENEY